MAQRWLSHCLSHWSGFCLVTFFQSSSLRQLNPLHQIRAALSISPLFLLFFLLLSIIVNPASIRKAPFTVSIPQGGLITPGCFVCLFLGYRSWIEQPAGVDWKERRAKKRRGGWRCVFLKGIRDRGPRSPCGFEEDRSAITGQKVMGGCLHPRWWSEELSQAIRCYHWWWRMMCNGICTFQSELAECYFSNTPPPHAPPNQE